MARDHRPGVGSRRQFLAACGGLGAAAVAAGRTAPRLSAGAAKRKVTPPLAVPYLTSSGRGTNAPFEGVHDDLYARALVLDDGRRAVAVLAVDAIGYDNAILGPGRDFTAELRRRVAAETGLEAGAVMLAATHTHQAPETIGLTPFRDAPGVPEWLEGHLRDLAATVIEAWGARVPVRACAGSARVGGVARNRRVALVDGTISRRGPLPPPDRLARPWAVDEDLAVLYLEADRGPLAALLNYTAHPVVTMLLPSVSADYCGAACAAVEAGLAGAVCLFTQGAAGDVNPVAVSTGFADARAIGRELGRAALAELGRLKAGEGLPDTAVRWRSREVTLAARDCPSVADAGRAAAARPTAANQAVLRLARKLAEGPIRAEVQAMGVGRVRWVSLPGEPFVETGLALKAAGASFVVGYANGWVGYLPVRAAYAEGDYEVNAGVWSRVAPGAAEQLQEVGTRLLGQVAEARP